MDPNPTPSRGFPYFPTVLLIIIILLAGVIFWFRTPLGTAWTAFMVPSELRSFTYFGTSPAGGNLFKIEQFGFKSVASKLNIVEYAETGSTEVAFAKGKQSFDTLMVAPESQLLSQDRVFKSDLSLSSDSTEALYVKGVNSLPFSPEASSSQVTLLNLETKKESLVGTGISPLFLSADGKTIGYVTRAGFAVSMVGSNKTQVSHDFTVSGVRPILVSPDYHYIVGYDLSNAEYDVYAVTQVSPTFTVQKLGTLDQKVTSIAFNGNALYGILTSGGKTVVYKYSLTNGSLGSGSLFYTFPSDIMVSKITE